MSAADCSGQHGSAHVPRRSKGQNGSAGLMACDQVSESGGSSRPRWDRARALRSTRSGDSYTPSHVSACRAAAPGCASASRWASPSGVRSRRRVLHSRAGGIRASSPSGSMHPSSGSVGLESAFAGGAGGLGPLLSMHAASCAACGAESSSRCRFLPDGSPPRSCLAASSAAPTAAPTVAACVTTLGGGCKCTSVRSVSPPEVAALAPVLVCDTLSLGGGAPCGGRGGGGGGCTCHPEEVATVAAAADALTVSGGPTNPAAWPWAEVPASPAAGRALELGAAAAAAAGAVGIGAEGGGGAGPHCRQAKPSQYTPPAASP